MKATGIDTVLHEDLSPRDEGVRYQLKTSWSASGQPVPATARRQSVLILYLQTSWDFISLLSQSLESGWAELIL